ncbi:interferon-induced protein 44-like isoform X1 [Pristis pectinata]|uniref:interferon-induced protein 44-like isoform X1 n=1 Tax=Pristis pectinata TaxID=685728 RepID=UPI00223C93D7|nr:interferon-induced protein 44-like isoform X1 [Pristis pectinata]
MGSDFSKEDCFHFPTMDQRNLYTLRDYLCNYKPPKGCDHVNILLLGKVGAGKSSLINTFLSALHGRTISCVPTGGNPWPITLELKSYRTGKLQFWDTAAWNALENPERTKRVLLMILEGRVPPETNLQGFNPDSDDAKYPVIAENVIHGVAFIFDVNTMDYICEDKMKQFHELQTIVVQKYIYRVVIGTKFERLGIREKHHAWIYEYKPLQEKIKKLSDSTGMDKRSMFVVSNQWKGDQIEQIKCILALYVLENMVRNINKYLKVTV